ncbi:SDR family NAD(P)-dependent oxidoreductase [Mucilaginibacter sp. L3T2-6]|uniref:SDR family NAD(P)-dependent oxidoreductase n=1 Tax=Mucilaginibacter sp. L3T2-6 TaxID=3062491 RepID=UPI0026760D5B|nr:SDR family NAD(P)-dependent oxidoreductase [Mucilaginibacter sp. L3T2-6]MDO3641390.1 SDR family NAD(P)-dependent oxidoreductase [Mucilaginibacter sp. L3T2-6]MDV6213849.1 SDR family NAD(P)-dependent oxidoreductase [Mucilaginibacter sp. L3T2-6]
MKTVLITGANKGIGFEVAKQLAQNSHFVYLGSRNEGAGLEAVKKLNSYGITNVETLVIDVADINSVRQARHHMEAKISALDILINNAGIAGDLPQDFATGDVENLRRIFDTNFFGAVQTTQELLPLLKKAANAAIINVSSEVGSITLRTQAGRNLNRDKYNAYGASKTALNAFTVMLANELYDTGITVNSVTPGYTATSLNQFQGAKTIEQGAAAIVDIALQPVSGITGKFLKEDGEAAW